MNQNSIDVKSLNLADIFSNRYVLAIPYYQRQYAWEEDQSLELISDLFEFYKVNQKEPYFLGNIVFS